MNIELQNTGELTATVKIDLSPADYEEKVLKVLKDYQRKAQMPGFRPGKVPFGLTKKMYGSAVTADEINKILGESLDNFIREQKLDLLGNPIANIEKTPQIDFSEPGEMSFYFDLGLSPQFSLEVGPGSGVSYYRIEVSDEIARKYLEDMRMRNAVPEEATVSVKDDIISGEYAELDANGEIYAAGLTGSGSIDTSLIKDESIAAAFTGVETGAVIKFNPKTAMGNAAVVAEMMGIVKDRADNLEADFNFTVTGISHKVPAEVNAEFFEKVYPGVEIKDEQELIEQIKKDAAQSFVGESEKRFFNDAVRNLIEKAAINLPDEFMKRWLLDSNQDKLTAEEIELHYKEYANSMRWQLIENRLIRENNISVSEEEIRDVFRGYFRRPGTIELDDETQKRIEGIVDSFMKNKEDVRRINDQLFEQKLLVFLKAQLEPEEKVVSYEEFALSASAK